MTSNRTVRLVFFWLAARLFDRRTAFVAACLLGLNPFYIAHEFRLHFDLMAPDGKLVAGATEGLLNAGIPHSVWLEMTVDVP